ncbi:MAG: SpoIID/LytB domain-containing protein [Parcubacteria group bacterium]|jgi:hypothetical protein
MMKKIIAFFVFLSFLSAFFPSTRPAKADDSLVSVYSFWSKTSSYRFLTSSASEIKSLSSNSNWESEGILWYAYSSKQNDTVPIYRIKSSTYSYYYYTASKSKRSSLIKTKGWVDKGIAFYAYASKQDATTPVYALKNSKTKKYFYTSSPGEKNCMLTDSTWTGGETAFWVPKENANVSDYETTCRASYGPEISVGLWSYTKKDLQSGYFKIKANKDYTIKDKDGDRITTISAGTITKVKYNGDKDLLVYSSIKDRTFSKEVSFDAKDGNNSNLVFDIYRPGSSYDQYRGKIKIKYYDNDNIWVVNTLPMEQYVWGMGETTGTGPFEHTKVMTTMFRTYGYWYKEYATKYLKYGFTIRSDSGSQIYRGYDWEKKYPNIKKAAESTKGIIVKYKNEIALTPYSSWSDGRTRSFEERWGSDDYPWCKSVKDPYGKHPSLSTKKLEAAGNHMVGLIANGSLKLAGSKYKKKYDWILKYYYTKVSLAKMY